MRLAKVGFLGPLTMCSVSQSGMYMWLAKVGFPRPLTMCSVSQSGMKLCARQIKFLRYLALWAGNLDQVYMMLYILLVSGIHEAFSYVDWKLQYL